MFIQFHSIINVVKHYSLVSLDKYDDYSNEDGNTENAGDYDECKLPR